MNLFFVVVAHRTNRLHTTGSRKNNEYECHITILFTQFNSSKEIIVGTLPLTRLSDTFAIFIDTHRHPLFPFFLF